MSFSIRVCALVMAFSPCRSRKRPYHGLGAHLRWPFPPACRGKGDHGNMACACDSLSPLPVEETAIMGTWRALASPFSPCLSRKRPSWGACDPLFPLPVEDKDSRGTRQGSVAGMHMGLRSALKGCGAPEGSVAWNCLSFDRQGEMAITGTLVWGVVQDCLFTDRQREKGWRVPRGTPLPPPLALGF